MSAFNPKADIRQRIEHVCFVPIADIDAAVLAAKRANQFSVCELGTFGVAIAPNSSKSDKNPMP
jgi:hypothetical protein